MKKICSIVLAAFAIVAAASCAKEFASVDNNQPAPGFVTMRFEVSMDATRSTLSDDLKYSFENGDSVAVFDGLAATPNKFFVEGASGNNAYIVGTVSEGAEVFTAVYPFTAAQSLTVDNVAVTVPTTQVIAAGRNVDPAALVSYARAEKGSPLAFKNAVGLFKFTVSASDVTGIGIRSNGMEPIVGNETITVTTGEIVPSTSYILTIVPEGEGATLQPGTYYAAVVPSVVTSGLAAMAVKSSGLAYKVSDKSVTIVRNAGINIGAIDAVPFPEEIKTKDELVAFAKCSRFFPVGYEVKLGADIDLSGVVWPNPVFYGDFNGQNHRVYNFTTTNNIVLDNVGFIGTLGDGTNGATIKNLCVGSKDYNFDTKEGTYDGVSKITFESTCDELTASTYKYPGLVAYAHVGAVVDNVVNFINTEVTSKVNCKHRNGGICGTMKASVTVKNCINFGNLVDNSQTTPDGKTTYGMGGISGCIDGDGCKILNCVNKGNITSNSPWTLLLGGILGMDPKVGELDGCKNYGNVTHNGEISGAATSGGIVGSIKGISTFKNCENYGDVVFHTPDSKVSGGAVEIGGVAGYCNTASTFENCSNAGKVSLDEFSCANQVEVGGIIGRNVTKPCTYKNCHNTGDLTICASTTVGDGVNLGGLIGWLTQAVSVTNCSSKCTIVFKGYSKNSHVGGLLAYSQSLPVLTDCSFEGTIIANESEGGTKSGYGGCFGWNKQNSVVADGCTIKATIDIQKAAPTTYVGGLFGYASYTKAAAFAKTTVNSVITGAPTTYGGALVGFFDTTSTAVLTLGTTEDPVKVAGSFNGTALTSENYASYLKGSESTSTKLVINPAFLAE